jgi:hypothetical protein
MSIKRVLVALFLVLFIVGAGVLYTMWQKELDRKDSQEAALQAAQVLLPPAQAAVTAADKDLTTSKAKLAAAQANLAEWKDKWPKPPPAAAIQTIDYGTKLFILAANNTLNLEEFHGTDWSSTTLGGIKYQTSTLDAKVTGTIQNINNFIGNLETTDPYLTATIDTVNITFSTEFDPDLGAVPPPEATITISLLALEG